MKKSFINTLLAYVTAVAIFAFSSCGNSENKKVTEKEVTTDTLKKEEGIAEVTAEQMKTVGIIMGKVEPVNLTSTVKATGQLTVPPQNKAVVNALVGGVIRRINVREGQQVSKGQVVVAIENPDFIRLQQDYLVSKDNLVYLAQEFERQRMLKAADAGIGKVYQQASANYAAENTKIALLGRQLQQIHINPSQVRRGNIISVVSVVAPISGTVGKINLSVGTFTDVSSPIMEIVNNSIVYADLQVFEKDISKVVVGQKVNFGLTNQEDKKVLGSITGINKSFNGESKTVLVHAVVDNAAPLNLIAGMYVTALIETGMKSVSAVPKDAIVKANDKTYIFVLEEIEKEPVKKEKGDKEAGKNEFVEKYRFKMIEVVTGAEEMGYVEIKAVEEMRSDAKIVTKGAFYLYSSMQNTETDDI